MPTYPSNYQTTATTKTSYTPTVTTKTGFTATSTVLTGWGTDDPAFGEFDFEDGTGFLFEDDKQYLFD